MDVNEPKKPKSKRKSTSPRKVIIEYYNINLTIFTASILEHCNIIIIRYQTSQDVNKKAEKKKEKSRRASPQEVDTPDSKQI